MALKSKALPVLVLAALCLLALRGLAFVAPSGGMAARAGTGALAAGAAPTVASTPEGGLVAMQARGGAEGLEVEDPQLYIVLMSVLFGASVLANSNGFFGPS